MFPEFGDPPVPVWGPRGCYGSGRLSAGLRDDLRAWNDDWERRQDDDESEEASRDWLERWIAAGDELAERLSAETGHTVVVLGPERFGPSPDCPHCSPAAIRRKAEQYRAPDHG